MLKIGDIVNNWKITKVVKKKNKWRGCYVYHAVHNCGAKTKKPRLKDKFLRNKYCRSCEVRDKHRTNLVGKKYHKLIVLEHLYPEKGKHQLRVKCDCGNIVIRRKISILKGMTKSCGCIRRSNIDETMKKRTYYAHLANVKSRNLYTEITFSQFKKILIKPCVYCGKISNRRHNTGKLVPFNSLDRINNEPYYTLSNVQSVCIICQHMKKDLSDTQFKAHLLTLFRYRKKWNS